MRDFSVNVQIKNKSVNADTGIPTTIIGTYSGEVLDARITNNNGLDITDEVIHTVLESDDYKQGIENGWFIGFLGHPEDPNCMDFKNGCIVMTDMSIDDNGKVYGGFNLVGTPVGQVVKTFIDAGVKFGISIRGAGDIVDNSVDPETFVFRGFDLVSFPAYPESIPKFTAIAASTNTDDRKKYQSVCKVVRDNISAITSSTAIDVIQSQFAKQSDTYKMLQTQKDKLTASTETTSDIDPEFAKEKIQAMTDLCIRLMESTKTLSQEKDKMMHNHAKETISASRKIRTLKRITSSQMCDIMGQLKSEQSDYAALQKENKRIKTQLSDVKKKNLIYKQRVEASADELQEKQKIIASLKSQMRETVTASTDLETRTSNLDETNRKLRSELRTCKQTLQSFQAAYADIYASALGVNPGSLSITASTTVGDLQKMVNSATSTSNMATADMVEPLYIIDECDDTDDYETNDLVTM